MQLDGIYASKCAGTNSAGMFTVMVPDMIAPTEEILALCDACPKTLLEIVTLIQNMKGRQDHD